MIPISLPHQMPPRLLYQGAANAVACDIVSCKNATRVTFVVIHTGNTDTDLTLQLEEATSVAGATHQAVAVPCPIWRDNDAGTTSDTLVRQTDDDNIAIDPATEASVVAVIEWDPAKHSDGYDCIYLADTGGNAANTCTILAFVEMAYQGATPPSVIVD
jgi:hypothetical protein